ncbi:uncharacterized protein LOC142652784 [Rhinoderma darwinii]|uniref:uncharacterized protein LOC142652784 n=1 Tax=Rhinoderma darwinii TaxID=43563 RepID=UPI003F664774
MSSRDLSNVEISALNNGLTFSPTTNMDWFQLELDLFDFFRKIKFKVLFADKNLEARPEKHTEITLREVRLHKKSLNQPYISEPAIDAFINIVKQRIRILRESENGRFVGPPNLTRDEMVAIDGLSRDVSLTIKPADKGGALVVMDTSPYLAELTRQLADPNVYELLALDPKFRIKNTIDELLSEAYHAGIIDRDLLEFMTVRHPVVPVLYCLPKIHKSMVHPPGRSIISGCGSIFSPIAIFLDKILRNFAINAKSYIQDTTDFLTKLDEVQLEGDCILVSFDVCSLYTSINHTRGLRTVSEALQQSNYTHECINLLMCLLEIVLTENYFLYGDYFYAQKRGTAMGSNVAPTYVNMFMVALEECAIYVSPHFTSVLRW